VSGVAELRLLGPVEVIGPAGPASLAGQRVRALAAVLALRAGAWVDHAALVEAVWGDAGAPAELRAALAELSAALPELSAALDACGLAGVLDRGAGAARLRIDGGAVDAMLFDAEVAGARARAAAGELAGAGATLETALARWRGDLEVGPLADCELYGWAAAEVARLAETRTAALEDRWEFGLRPAIEAVRVTGGPVVDRAAMHAAVAAKESAEAAAADLEVAVAVHPLRERLWELLLLATFVAGRRRDALAVYERACRVFTEELGVPPGDRLRALDAAARRGEVGELTAPAAVVPRPRPPADPPLDRATLPAPLTRLLGRDALLARVADQLARHRLVTLTGPGGCGKTRLAIAVATRWAGGPVVFADLSGVTEDPAAALAAALGVRDEPEIDAIAAAADRLCGRRVLLLMDNCEHLVAASGRLAEKVLRRCPDVTLLCTSRTPLRVADEVAVAVPTLPLTAAARLFRDRALARSGWPVPESSAAAVTDLCTELDGLPLAIELAAARTPVLTVPEIVTRLRTDLQLLRSPDPTAPARHRTLAAAVESSVGQLDPDARTLFRRLAVFAGGFDAAAAGAVGGTGDALRALVAASLVSPIGSRYRMLTTIQRVAHDRLVAAGEEVAARRAHAAHFLAEAERAEPLLHGPDQERWQAVLRADRVNLSAALTWLSGSKPAPAVGSGEPAEIRHGDLRLAAALATFCHLEGRYREGRAWLRAALARHPDAPPALRARAEAAAAMLAMLLCDYPAAIAHAIRARADCHLAGDPRGEARTEMLLGAIARERAEYAESSAHLDAAAARYAECGDEWGEARAAQLRGFTAWLAGDLDRAEPRLYACWRRFERLGDAEAAAAAVVHLGAVAHYRGDTDRAAALLDAGLRRYAVLDFPEGVAWAHNVRGLVDLRAGRTARAGEHLRRSLELHREVGDRWRTASVLEALAELARVEGAAARAAGLLGAAVQVREAIGAPVPACERADLDATRRALRAELGESGYAAAAARGREGPLDALLHDVDGVPVSAAVSPAG
jgi:predicted ATPase/DNA-binding SARP family transcriptional activator